MTELELNNKLAAACDREPADPDEIRKLIIAGADTNQADKYGESIFADIFRNELLSARDIGKRLPKSVDKIKEIITLMIAKGFDIKRFGIPIMKQFMFFSEDHAVFDLYRFMLQYDLADDPKAYDDLLEGIGIEESYQRCCENNHDLENLYYGTYEMIKAKKESKNYKSIELYYDAVGMTIDKIVYFSETDRLIGRKDFTEYNADIGFVCGEKLLVLTDGVNILFMNDRIKECPQRDISSVFGKNAVGEKIKSISFDHKNVIKDTTEYGQPTIIIELEKGKKLRFTHNYGEASDKKTQARFWIE